MEERRDLREHGFLGLRIADLLVESQSLGLPPLGNALQSPHPVGDAENLDAHAELIRLQRKRGKHHISALTSPDHSDPVLLDVHQPLDPSLPLHSVPYPLPT